MTAIIKQIQDWRASGIVDQLFRFGIAGGLASVIYFAVYMPLALYVFGERLAVLAVPPAFLVAVVAGFFLHSAWSFKGHGTREQSGRQHAKFFIVQSAGLVLNAAFTWIITGPLFHGSAWLPMIPALTITPLATFALNRRWVFG